MSLYRFRHSERRNPLLSLSRLSALALLLAVMAGALALLAGPGIVDAASSAGSGQSSTVNPQQGSGNGSETEDFEIQRLAFTSVAGDGFYEPGDTIAIEMVFNKPFTNGGVEDSLTLPLEIGLETHSLSAIFSDTSALFFHNVTHEDFDSDGVSVAANSVSGTLVDGNSVVNARTLSHDELQGGEDHRVQEVVVESMAFHRDPGASGSYSTGDEIYLKLTFSQWVSSGSLGDRSGFPTLGIEIGDNVRQADLDGGGQGLAYFMYTVQADDIDEDGIAVPANPFAGLLAVPDGREIEFSTISHSGISSDSRRLVNAQPDIDSIEIASDAGDDDTYSKGETITVRVTFDSDVYIAYNSEEDLPTIGLKLDGGGRTATAHVALPESKVSPGQGFVGPVAASSPDSTEHTTDPNSYIDFKYTVVLGDSAADGLAIKRNSLSANDASIKYKDDGTHVNLLHRAVDADDEQLVDSTASIVGLEFASEPGSDLGYLVGDEIEVEVSFSTVVEVGDGIDAPELSATDHNGFNQTFGRTFVYSSGSGTDTFIFTSTVEKGDKAFKGISIDPITDADEWDESLGVDTSFQGLGSEEDQRVYGGVLATSVSVTSTPDDAVAYRSGETFTFEVGFGENMAFETEPEIHLQVGATRRTAILTADHDYTEVTTFSFEYTFKDSDGDSDGIEIIDTYFRVDNEFPGGYIFPQVQAYDYMPVWKFVNVEPGALSDHKVVGSSDGLSWLPAGN